MGINASNVKSTGNKQFVEQPAIEAGVYPARLVQVIDMGLQPQRPYQGQDKPPAHDINFTFELVDCFMVDEEGNEIEDKPRWVSTVIPLKPLVADLAKSTKLAKAIDPDNHLNGDFGKMLGMPLNITIGISEKAGKTYTNVLGFQAMRARDAAKCPELKNDVRVFDLDAPNMEIFNALPEWLREKIKSNLEYAMSPLERALGGEAPAPKEEAKEAKEEAVEQPEGDDGIHEDAPW